MDANRSSSNSKIPRLLRSASFSGQALKKPVPVIDEDQTEAQDDLGSLSSVCSVVSCAAPSSAYRRAVDVARGFQIKKPNSKYAIHCCPSNGNGNQDYLTPTQRANRTIRQLKTLLKESEAECNYKDLKIQQLTRELVAMRLEHAECEESGQKNGEIDAVSAFTPLSLSDSGLFDDLNHGIEQSKETLAEKDASLSSQCISKPASKLAAISQLEQVKELKKQQVIEIQNIKSRFTDRLESALNQLGDANTRYANLLSSFENSREELETSRMELKEARQMIPELEKTVTKLQLDIESRELLEYENREKDSNRTDKLHRELADKHQLITILQERVQELTATVDHLSNIQLKIDSEKDRQLLDAVSQMQHQQEQELPSSEEGNGANSVANHRCNNRNIISEDKLLAEDAAITLKFLRSAIFYLLTDGENWSGHLGAVSSILEFTPEERLAIERAGRHYL